MSFGFKKKIYKKSTAGINETEKEMDKQAATIITNHGFNQLDGDDNGNTGKFSGICGKRC